MKACSEGGKARELLLEKAQVFRMSDGVLLFDVPLVYLARKPEELHVDYPFRQDEVAEASAVEEGQA